MKKIDKAVIMARGLGTRMRKAAASQLSGEQAKIADTGIKALIPIDRPFLDYILSALADAGFRRVCLIIGPEHDAIRNYYGQLKTDRVRIEFAIQEKPRGTADAVAAAEKFAGDDGFVVINSDNYYPVIAFEGLAKLDGPGTAVFDKDGMLAGSNIPPERISAFAVVEVRDGKMVRILEKPSADVLAKLTPPIGLSMQCWRFDKRIFEACRNIKPSPRNELELPDAVQYTIDKLGAQYAALMFKAPVLDMSSREDIAAVAAKLKGVKVVL